MKLSDQEIKSIVKAEEVNALDYQGELATKRARLMDAYNCKPYGDEIEGHSKAISSDVSDTVETLMPGVMRVFTQGRLIANFEADAEPYEQEAKDKTELSNYVFMKQNNGFMVLENMFKDALLQFTGTVKVSWDECAKTYTTQYSGLSELEYKKLLADPEVQSVDEVEEVVEDGIRTYNCEKVVVKKSGKVRYDNIPPEEFLISKNDRDFLKPRFIGHRTPTTRSKLLEMGFGKETVRTLPADEYFNNDEQGAARNHDLGMTYSNPSKHSPNDTIYLGEYYMELDVNGDGITEYWQIFYAGNQILEKVQVEDHPFAVAVPIPIPHRAIGTCPAEQAFDIQYRKTHLERNLYDNIYQTNFPRVMHSNLVDLDDLLTPRPGGTIEIDTDAADVAGHAQPLVIPNMIGDILQAIEYTDNSREERTGVTRYHQGLDSEALNKTATGFRGMMDASQQREYLIARNFAEGGVKQIFEKTVMLLSKHQDTTMHVKVAGKPLEIDPRKWGENCRCSINVGLGSGDRQEKIANLNNVLNYQMMFKQSNMVLSDQGKIFKTLEKLIDETGLKDASVYFNNPEVPEETLQAQNEQMAQMLQAMEAQMQNPLAEAEMIKAQGKIATDQMKAQNDMQQFLMKLEADVKKQVQDVATKMTELELKYQTDVPGSTV